MNKNFRIVLGTLFLISFTLIFYLIFKIQNNRDYFAINEDHYIAIDIVNEIYLTSHQLNQYAVKYLETADETYYSKYNSIIKQTLGLAPRSNYSLYHIETINLFTILQKNIPESEFKNKLVGMYEQLLIQNNFQTQAFTIFKKTPFPENAIKVLQNPSYTHSLESVFTIYNELLSEIKHVEKKFDHINLKIIIPFSAMLFLVTIFCVLLYLYKNNAFSRNKMGVNDYINLLVNSMPFVSVIFDNNGKVIGCNKKLLELLDLKSESQFISDYQNYFDMIQEHKEIKQFIQEKNILIKQNNIAGFNFVFRDANQNPIQCQVTALYFEYRDKPYFIYYAFNSQKELEMQAKLKEQEERMQIMLDSNPLCCSIWDENYNLIDCNYESARLFNFKSKQEYIENFSKINPICQPDGQFSSDKYIYLIQKAFISGYESFEWLHQDLNHTLIPCRITLVRISYKNTNIIAGYTRDLREEKKIFNKLKRKQTELVEAKLQSEQEAKAKSEFLAIMSHEIRTPLNAIINIFGFLTEIELDDKHKNFVQKGMSSANILLHTINDILDYSKIDAGQLNIENISFSLNDLVQNIYNLFVSQIKKKGLDFILEQEKGLENMWLGDPMRITQIINNLLSNALKFTETGSITLKVSSVAENKNDSGTDAIILFEVIDTGIGITQQQLKKIFTPFMQADTSTTRKYGGTGLGLSISNNLAKLMHGKLYCESAAGQGSNFKLEIPLTLDKNSAIPAKEDAAEINYDILSNLEILLVEDNQINTLVACELLKKKGIKPDTAVNGIEALKKAGEKIYDIILMDIQMPQMDGITATKHLRQDLSLQTPIIAMTANVLEQDKQLYMRSGFNAHIGKPIIPAELYKTLAEFAPHKD